MLGTRYEEYEQWRNGLPFVLNVDIKKNYHNLSKENNWHENPEIQFCTNGSGTVLLNGKEYPFCKNSTVFVNSNIIHYTATKKELTYDCLIVGTEFCRQMNFNLSALDFEPVIESAAIGELFSELKSVYADSQAMCRIARLNMLLIQIMIEIIKHGTAKNGRTSNNKSYERIKLAILYIRNNYQKKITLDEIAKAVILDKYMLCKEFKKYTGQTVFENLNNYRCIKAIDCLDAGHTVTETASLCGFDNLSFFAKTFKKHIGILPSQYKKHCN
ncbi:MAG: helix-turn-helix domain-containing protein [Ruminococcaceae bacterium]|nr:helix-turn-helix domain-containing protein [Oscillospiraceae bacterium]